MAIVTGNVALPALDVEATMPIEVTVPNTRFVVSVGVISAWSPFFSCARSALPTDASTIQLLVEMTTIWVLDELEDVLLPVPVPELPVPVPELPLPPEFPLLLALDPLPDTWSPAVMLTAATVPAIGDRRVAAA